MPARRAVVSCLVTRNDRGRQLLELLDPVVRAAGAEVRIRTPEPRDLRAAIVEDDAVIFDGSVERGHIYGSDPRALARMDHVLVVSRTPVASNLQFLRSGGAPMYPAVYTNEQIQHWVTLQLRSMHLPRQRDGTEAGRQRLNREGQVFISYRSNQWASVVGLQQRIEDSNLAGVRGRSAFFFGPSELVYEHELLTELHQWAINAVIRNRVEAADEMLVVNSPDYLGSWWTAAEVIMIALARRLGRPSPKIVVYDPGTDSVRPEPDGFVPQLSSDQIRRLKEREDAGDRVAFVGGMKLLIQALAPGNPLGSQFQDHALLRCPSVFGASKAIDVDQFLRAGDAAGVTLYPHIRLIDLDGWPGYKCRFCGQPIAFEAKDWARHWWSPTDGSLSPLNVFTAKHD